MLYRTILKLVELGMTDGLEEKIDVLFAAGKLAPAEYADLAEKISAM